MTIRNGHSEKNISVFNECFSIKKIEFGFNINIIQKALSLKEKTFASFLAEICHKSLQIQWLSP